MSRENGAATEVVRASELEKVADRIFALRNPDAMPTYRKKLATYRRRLGQRKEVSVRTGFLGETRKTGFRVTHLGQDVFVERPTEPGYSFWHRFRGHKDHFMGETSWRPGREVGLLADPKHNREIRQQRVEEYAATMTAGGWRDLLSDPITITANGHVVNGQHRLAAWARVEWDEVENDPAFLVVWGVDPKESLYADGSRRTNKDERAIAMKAAES
jgi:hypothetical protein